MNQIGAPLVGVYDFRLVVVSILVSILASYVALDLAVRVTAARGGMHRAWLASGAISMGLGIWSMHFVGMLAFRLPIPVRYDVPTVLLSLLAAILASAVALYAASRERFGRREAVVGSLVMGGGISAMHYTGMAAMRLPATCRYDPLLLGLSIIIAVVASLAALTFAFNFHEEPRKTWAKGISATVMGIAIASMHYSGMASARFVTSNLTADSSRALSVSWLGTAGVVMVALMTLGLTLLTTFVGGQFAAQSADLQLSENRYRLLFEHSLAGIYRTMLDGRVLDCNEACASIFRYGSRREFLAHTATDTYFKPEDRETFTGQMIENKTIANLESRLRAKDGTTVWVLENATLIDGGDGVPAVIEGTLIDITKRKLAEETLRVAQETLETRVMERTAELKKINEALRSEIAERKLAEEAVKRAEDRTRLILDTTPALIHSGLPNGDLVFFNQGWLHYVGLSLEDLSGWKWTDAIHPEDVSALVEKWRAALATGEPFEHEARVRRADGVYRWMVHRKVPLRDKYGNIVQWCGTSNDIEALKTAEDRIRLIIDTIPMMAWSVRPDGVVDFLNQRWLDYCGLSLKEYVPEPTRPIHPEDVPRILEKWRVDMAAGEPFEDEMRLRRTDGEYRWFLVRTAPLRDEQGNVVKWYGVSIDIEDRKRTEEALRSSEREHRHIAAELKKERARLVEAQAVAKIGSWEAELQTLSVIWSEQTHRIFETDPSCFEPTRPKFQEFIHPKDRAKVAAAFAESLDKRSPCTVEYRIVMRDGRVKVVEERWQAFHDAEGKPVRVAGTCRDITERARAEEQLRRLSGELLRSQDEERRRIARELHDSTGQDLVALATMLGQLRRLIPLGERKSRRLLSKSKALADRCIGEVRTLSYVLHPPVLDQAGLCDAIRDYVNGFAKRTGIQVELEVPGSLGRMPRDMELALFRVVQEALTNIQRHSGSQQARIRIHSNANFALEISDQGHGASAHSPRGAPQFGMGVGIPSMQERVRLIGGRLDIESTAHGTTVRVTIPFDRSEHEKTPDSDS